MGRFTANEIDNYGSGGGASSYFTLADDGDMAVVRLMYNGIDDVSGYAVHEVMIGDKKRYVNCLRSYNEPKSNCPLCNANNFQRAKLYVPLYVVSIKHGGRGDYEEVGEVRLWERGKTFFQKLAALCARYSNNQVPLVAHTFEIERHGKKGDTSTQYDIFETGSDDTKLEDLPEIPEILGSIVLDKSFEEQEHYLNTGEFPDTTSGGVGYQRQYSEPTGRRTPASSGSGAGSRRREAF